MSAFDVIVKATNTIRSRGQDYDSPEGERSGGKAAAAFSAITGKQISASEVYLLLQIVKDVRQWTSPQYHEDSAIDCIAYAGLKAESLERGE